MADETTKASTPPDAGTTGDKTNAGGKSSNLGNSTPEPEKVAKFRVTHGAVSGVVPDPKNPGRNKEHDFYAGSIVTDEQLSGQAAQYLVIGAIERVDE
jgi:hypothetical protein